MSTATANGTLDLTNWEEAPFSEVEDGPKMAGVSSDSTYAGEITGTGKLRYTIQYDAGDSGTGRFLGFEQVVGSLDGRTGSFVLKHEGAFAQDGTVTYTITVVAGTGTGDLTGLRGEGTVVAKPDGEAPYTLSYEIT
jgi:hypothetical protein